MNAGLGIRIGTVTAVAALDTDPVKRFKDFVADEPGETPPKKAPQSSDVGTSVARIKSRLLPENFVIAGAR